MTQQQGNNRPFCGLTLTMYSTGNRPPKMEFQASSNKAKFKCTLTKDLYGLEDINKWLQTPQVQQYVRDGFVPKWGSKTSQKEPTKYGDGTQLEITFYMVKPRVQQGYTNKPVMQQPNPFQGQQQYQARHEMDDQLPQSEKDWSQGSATDFNPEEYDRELM